MKSTEFAFKHFHHAMRGELSFLCAEAPLIAEEKGIEHQRVYTGYISALKRRSIFPRGWNRGTLEIIAKWILQNPPVIRIKSEFVESRGRNAKLITVKYPSEMPFMGVDRFISDEIERCGADRVWLRPSNN